MIELKLADNKVRFINLIVDLFAFLILWFVISVLFIALGFDQVIIDETGEEIPIAPFVLLLPSFWFYYFIFEITIQKTPGKLLTKSRGVLKSGSKPSPGQIIGRTLSRSIPLEYFSYLTTNVGIHDRLSGTRVVKD